MNVGQAGAREVEVVGEASKTGDSKGHHSLWSVVLGATVKAMVRATVRL